MTAGIVEVHEQVAGLLGQPGTGGVSGDPEDVRPAGGVLDEALLRWLRAGSGRLG